MLSHSSTTRNIFDKPYTDIFTIDEIIDEKVDKDISKTIMLIMFSVSLT